MCLKSFTSDSSNPEEEISWIIRIMTSDMKVQMQMLNSDFPVIKFDDKDDNVLEEASLNTVEANESHECGRIETFEREKILKQFSNEKQIYYFP